MAMALDPALPVGMRIKLFRERAGKSRAALAGLVGRSESWLKAVENGRLLPPRLPLLIKLAEHLGIDDLSQLTGDVSLPRALFSGTEHPALSVVRRAVDTAPLGLVAGPVPDSGHISAQLSAAWRARDASGNHRTALAELLPSLVMAASTAASHPECSDRRRAEAMYASALNLTQMFAAYQGDGNLVWRVAERSLATARASGDLAAVGQACWFLVEAFRKSGQWDSAQTLTEEALRLLGPVKGDSAALARAWADMAFHAAITHAAAGEAGSAWGWFDRAEATARTLPAEYWHSPTSGSARVIPLHGVTVAVELRQAGTALRWADRVSPEAVPARPCRARHLIEVARAHALRSEHDQVASLLSAAVKTAPETARWNRETHEMVRGLLAGPASTRAQARKLATATGVAA
ncbi:helix-turn-helix transcriptional regulator [Kitasatospora acidiphila]|uniref:Helix-turn-helix transcriptional regulator n=1 Tax=Kitasatospora acidiphila TaxID=2567942 RepID=A0A540W0F0_9ACTN|nr:helix-turn-helix domain-containing protein [Kitasatospora acidiphila]TQF02502.1 helix-turn-helix transcriptional regulator [Kitasatospora acidiphila]